MASSPDSRPLTAPRLRISGLRHSGPTRFHLEPDAGQRDAIAEDLGAESIRKLRFEGELQPRGKAGWRLVGDLGATVVQPCVVTLEPVTTRIDTPVERVFVPATRMEEPEPGSETEMPEDDSVEPLGDEIDLESVMIEVLSLAMPTYPRKEGIDPVEARYAEDGVKPMTDEDTKPFAGLAGLREKMQDKGGKD